MVSGILFIDIELDRNDRIMAVGAILGDVEQRWNGGVAARDGLAQLAERASLVAAHHGHAHDLAHISRVWPGHPVLLLPLIDTLLLSPLAFPENPYHHLVKDRRLVREEGNDPIADARACRKVLADQLAWIERSHEASDPRLPLIRRALVDHFGEAPWRGSTERLFVGVDDVDLGEAIRRASAAWEGRVCESARQRLGAEPPSGSGMAWAYVASWLTTQLGSILPAWVWHAFPETRAIVTALRERDCGSCAWCSRQHSPEAQLTRWFPDHRSFRALPQAADGTSMQRAIVAAGLRDEPVFAVLPTGGGKSIAFQVPAFARYERRGALTVVISPLQSLMKDQVDNLVLKTGTTHSAAIYGALTLVERRDVMERVRSGNIGLLYVSPEQLRNPGVRKMLASREIGAWVFDEAHCIAEWGHDFRPDFWYAPRYIRELAKEQGVPVPSIAAFTATAQPEVTQQILDRVRTELGSVLVAFNGGAERTNLAYRVETCDEKARLGRAIELLEELRDDRHRRCVRRDGHGRSVDQRRHGHERRRTPPGSHRRGDPRHERRHGPVAGPRGPTCCCSSSSAAISPTAPRPRRSTTTRAWSRWS